MSSKPDDFNPDQFQMSIGDHLEELRRRILLGLVGLLPAVIICLVIGKQILKILCWPLTHALGENDISTQLYGAEVTEGFMDYIRISMITAVVLAGPWLLYQIWQFVSTGLYPRERKMVTKYIPLSITLLLAGVLFVYFLVLPLSLEFFLSFTAALPSPSGTATTGQPTETPTFVQALRGDPAKPVPYQIWFNLADDRLKIYTGEKIRVIPFGPDSLVTPQVLLGDYLDLVLRLLLTFGLAFQLPLVVMALARVGIVDLEMLRGFRRYVYLGLCVLAAAISPGDVVTATVALLLPLIGLYELGILLAKSGTNEPRRSRH